MKTATQLLISALSAGALLAAVGSQAQTAVSELPLKASVLAKPNVIWGLDDSGSMDSEVLMPTNDGAFWWDHNAATGWNSSGVLHFNAAGNASSQWRKVVYLFPNGTGTGDRIYDDDSNDHFAAMPTAQFAFLRSPQYNPLYFNPSVTYRPWSPAHVSGAVRTYSDAAVSAARSHPVIGTSTVDLTADRALNTTDNTTFIALPGMRVPAGSQTCVHSACSTWTTETVERTVPASTVLRVAMAYFPATYYLRESCTVNGTSCVSAPDGSTLRRYEIKPAAYASEVAYNAAIQNFANWYTYYRKRKLMINAAVGQVLEPLTGVRMGFVRFNSRGTVSMFDLDSSSAASNGRRVAGLFYETNGNGGTPTRETLNHIGNQYVNTSSIIQFACQRNNAFIVTDGFANASSVTPPTYSQATWGAGVPYETTYAGTLADIALSYYTINLRPTMATQKVPTRSNDLNRDLHMNTYGLTVGARGTIFNGPGTALPTAASAWPNPTDNRSPTSVDDLWHATINGRGLMYLASTPAETASAIQEGLNDIISGQSAQSGVAVSTVNLIRGDSRAYFGTYDPAGWRGDVVARAINTSSGVIATTNTWSASALLTARDWTTRVIASHDGSGGVGFTAAGVGSLVNPGNVYGATADVINYLRGDRSKEGTTFRRRTALLGAIFNSEPAIGSDGVLYVASGEGMLHAIDTVGADAGKELWAYVPRAVLPDIGATTERAYAFRTQLDGSPVLGTIGGGKKILVAGMGAAGRSYYALDVSTSRGLSETQLAGKTLWEFPAATDSARIPLVGQTLGVPVIARTTNDGWVVLVTSGHNNSDGVGRLWMLNAETGAVIHTFSTGVGTATAQAGLAQVSALEEPDGTAQFVYGGDLLGNLWRFDLNAKTSPTKVANLIGPSGSAQPVTAAPELTRISGQRVIIVPTGRLLHQNDFGNSAVQSIYAITDGTTLASARAGLTAMTFTRGTPDTLTGGTVDWATGRGWYMDLPAGEQGNTRPSITYGGVAFVTNKNGANDCTAESFMYLLDVKTGKKHDGANFISTPVSTTANASRVTVVVTQDANRRNRATGLVQDHDDRRPTPPQWSAPPIPAAKTAWREVRR